MRSDPSCWVRDSLQVRRRMAPCVGCWERPVPRRHHSLLGLEERPETPHARRSPPFTRRDWEILRVGHSAKTGGPSISIGHSFERHGALRPMPFAKRVPAGKASHRSKPGRRTRC